MDELRRKIPKLWKKISRELDVEESRFENIADEIAKSERQAEQDAQLHLQPWITILEEGIHWLCLLHLLLNECASKNFDVRLAVPCSLVGAACSQSVAVRRLILSGLDSSAKSIARALAETLHTCIAVSADYQLAKGFHQAQTSKEGKNFWHQNLSTKKLEKRLEAIEETLDIEEECRKVLKIMRQEEASICSETIHPNYVAASLASDVPIAGSPNLIAKAILGHASAGSGRTLSFVCLTINYFADLGYPLLFERLHDKCPLIALDLQNQYHQGVYVGKNVYQKILYSHIQDSAQS